MKKEDVAHVIRLLVTGSSGEVQRQIRVAATIVEQCGKTRFRYALATVNKEDNRFQRKPKEVKEAPQP